MDRSVDSIGSCSLDVDADSSEMSDCSSIFLTPLSTKDLTREFTSQIQDRCPVKLNAVQNSIVTVDNEKGACQVKTIITQPACIDSELPVVPVLTAQGKKPSYLNLACCVNGYSSITTYDSKIRQDINKSREVSPIRPSTTGIQYCKNINIPLPIKVDMPNQNNSNPEFSMKSKKDQAIGMKYTETNNSNDRNGHGNVHQNLLSSTSNNSESTKSSTSFIQQRVERLYGPGALAQGFYSPKKVKAISEYGNKDMEVVELSHKLKQISPNKDFNDTNRKSNSSNASSINPLQVLVNDKHKNSAVDLPVLRHLSQEFRAQLPSISPKRNYIRNTNVGCTEQSLENAERKMVINDECLSSALTQQPTIVIDEVDYRGHQNNSISIEILQNKPTFDEIPCDTISKDFISSEIKGGEFADKCNNMNNTIEEAKDGSYFLKLLKIEQEKLLVLAERSEKYINILSTNTEISEDILGILRSASGKARLLVSQKLKQFEGLCQNNLNRASEDKFPTTMEDLQGFWDMVNLQIDDVNCIFKEIDLLKQNDWKKTIEEITPVVTQNATKKHGNMKQKNIPNIGDNSLKTKSISSASALKREAQRKQLLELKRKHKIAMAGGSAVLFTDDIQCTSFKSPDRLIGENCS